MRLDLYLVEKGHVTSRTRAQRLIEKGRVCQIHDGKSLILSKASFQVPEGMVIEVAQDELNDRYVSRGGIKLSGALERVGLKVNGFEVLDLGISTGGFTDCLLQAGAARVVGVDVGHGQLALKLAKDARVTLIEGVNARNLVENPVLGPPRPLFDLLVADVSFISLTLVLPQVIQYLKEGARLLCLVKPQFEVGRSGIGKGGIVKDPALFSDVEAKIRECCLSQQLEVDDYFPSPIEGSDGNREFFVLATRPGRALANEVTDGVK